MNEYIEMTIRIDVDAHPLLFEYLSKRRPGKPRAAAFKRLAENALLLSSMPELAASHEIRNEKARAPEFRMNQPPLETPVLQQIVSKEDVNASLSQFMRGGNL